MKWNSSSFPNSILYLNHADYLGGAEIALLDFFTHADHTLYSPLVLAPDGALAEALRERHIRHITIPRLPGLNRYTLPRFVMALPRLFRHLRREAPPLIHANTNFASQYAGVLSRVTGIPSVGHIRDIEPPGRIGRRMLSWNTRLIAISEAVRRYLIAEQIPEERIIRVYDGVDLTRYQPERITPFPRPPEQAEALIVGIVGQLGARKGHLELLEAFWQLNQRYPDTRLWIVGTEPSHSTERYTERLHQTIQTYQLASQVTFWGFQQNIPGVLAALDILVLPSRQEPFGKIVIEAMAMGKPVVASAVGGVPEIVADEVTGLLVPPQNIEVLSCALDALFRDPARRQRMGQAGRRRVEQHFRLEENVRATERLYQQMLRCRNETS